MFPLCKQIYVELYATIMNLTIKNHPYTIVYLKVGNQLHILAYSWAVIIENKYNLPWQKYLYRMHLIIMILKVTV